MGAACRCTRGSVGEGPSASVLGRRLLKWQGKRGFLVSTDVMALERLKEEKKRGGKGGNCIYTKEEDEGAEGEGVEEVAHSPFFPFFFIFFIFFYMLMLSSEVLSL